MASCGNPEGLDLALAQATNPLDREVNLEAVQRLCQLILLSREAPQEVLRIIAHKVQSPQEREALRALEVLEECVSRCGGKLNNEVGKFRFLNELIRVVSPKYLGQRAPESVKRRVVEILYKWSVVLAHETKIVDAYAMLKRQGVVEDDPIHVLPRVEAERIDAPPPREDEIFTDKQKELELKRLLGSKNPEDLQAANRLIKTMVKEADRKMDLRGRKLLDLEEAANNCAVFSDLLKNFRPDMKFDELELLQQMFENCDKLRPKLFTLASEFSLIEDFPSVQEVLQQNDELTTIINEYKDKVAPLMQNRLREQQLRAESHTVAVVAPTTTTALNAAVTTTNAAVTATTATTSPTITLTATATDSATTTKQTPTLSVAPTPSLPTTVYGRMGELACGSSTATPPADEEHLNFDPLTSKSSYRHLHHESSPSASNHADDVSLLDSQMSSLTVSPIADSLISIDGSTLKQHDLLMNLMDLQVPTEASSTTINESAVAPSSSSVQQPVSDGLPQPPHQLPVNNSSSQSMAAPAATAAPLSTATAAAAVAGGVAGATASTQRRSYAPFEGLDTLMSERIMATTKIEPAALIAPSSHRGPTSLAELDELTLADIVPSAQPPVVLSSQDDVTTVLHVTNNHPADDVIAVLLTTTNRNPKAAVKNFRCTITSQGGGGGGGGRCDGRGDATDRGDRQIRALPASGNQLPVFNALLPSTAITQIVLLVKSESPGVQISFTITYTLVVGGGKDLVPVTISASKRL